MKKLVREVPLSNGLTLRFFDASRRYFGDYHQVRLEICCEVDLTPDLFDDPTEFETASRLLGAKVQFLKQVEHQGVPTGAVSGTVEQVIQQFLDHSGRYLDSGAFPRKLVHSELARLRSRRKSFVPPPANG
ncbi:hypothetical protein L4X63_07800 [Geomonas sp. Red32]|uniref:hypothetical protein n=1 Tax=Geomonas sp. Red32 TaxID=2912856 RepID=UPI00202CBE95|nr:hypothetical protein [Geomonas sp. Red32]MCM0081487.1 hypothetical protein [Geomonas sp. Red32]